MKDDIYPIQQYPRTIDPQIAHSASNRVAREKRAIEQQDAWLGKTLEETHTLITELTDAIVTILNPQDGPLGQSTDTADPLGSSPLYYSLRDKTIMVAVANDRLRLLLHTIEL